jgi:hypothetical protein
MDERSTNMKYIAFVVLIAATLACGSPALRDASTPTPAPPLADTPTPIATETPAPDVGDKYGAIAICKKFVAARLIAPREAKWPGLFEKEEVTQAGPDTWRVVSWVDAANRMGTLIRMPYTCEVRYIGSDKWRLLALDMQEP